MQSMLGGLQMPVWSESFQTRRRLCRNVEKYTKKQNSAKTDKKRKKMHKNFAESPNLMAKGKRRAENFAGKKKTLKKNLLKFSTLKTVPVPQKNCEGGIFFFAEVGIEVAVTIGVTLKPQLLQGNHFERRNESGFSKIKVQGKLRKGVFFPYVREHFVIFIGLVAAFPDKAYEVLTGLLYKMGGSHGWAIEFDLFVFRFDPLPQKRRTATSGSVEIMPSLITACGAGSPCPSAALSVQASSSGRWENRSISI